MMYWSKSYGSFLIVLDFEVIVLNRVLFEDGKRDNDFVCILCFCNFLEYDLSRMWLILVEIFMDF